jgi:hypothetical protein
METWLLSTADAGGAVSNLWGEDDLPAWDVKVGDRVRQGVDPVAAESEQEQVPPVGTQGTVTWVQHVPGNGRPEVEVRWDGFRYTDPKQASLATWIEPIAH